MLEVVKSDQALIDIVDLADYLSQRVDDELAERFLQAVERTIEDIALFPSSGVARNFGMPELKGLRMKLVRDFPNHLIFYHDTDESVTVRRVLHGSRDIPRALANP